MTQLEISLPVKGKSYDAKKDKKRIDSMRQRIWDLMSDGEWRTVTDIKFTIGSFVTRDSCDVTRRIREMRDIGFKVEKKRWRLPGLWAYRAIKK